MYNLQYIPQNVSFGESNDLKIRSNSTDCTRYCCTLHIGDTDVYNPKASYSPYQGTLQKYFPVGLNDRIVFYDESELPITNEVIVDNGDFIKQKKRRISWS